MKTRLQSIKTLKRKADRLLQLVNVPLNPICLVCDGQTSEMHHIVYKSQSNNLRYDISNLVPLCRSCHFKHHNVGESKILAEILKIKGHEWHDDLQVRRRIDLKLNKGYLKEVIKELT